MEHEGIDAGSCRCDPVQQRCDVNTIYFINVLVVWNLEVDHLEHDMCTNGSERSMLCYLAVGHARLERVL